MDQSQDSTLSLCPHRRICSGCVPDPLSIQIPKRAVRFFESLNVPGFQIIGRKETGWRTKAKLAVRKQKGNSLSIGLFRRGTHEVVSIPRCLAHHQKINEAVYSLATLPPSLGYDEATQTGDLKYIQAAVERSSQRVQLSFVLNVHPCDSAKVCAWEHRAREVFSTNAALWHSLWLNFQPKPINTIFGPTWKHIIGPSHIWETLAGTEIPFLPSHFAQANLEMFEELLEDLMDLLPPKASVVELFAGMGVITLVIRPRCLKVVAIERDESAFQSFQQAKERLPADLQEGMDFVVADALSGHEAINDATTLIVDPPRKGLSPTLVRTIVEAKSIDTLFYISCHFPTLERDLADLIECSGFRIDFARSYIFFPGTDQIETLVRLVRQVC
jgi:23S rRNA (uracil1939-C5)-methyltransferase